MAVKYTCNWPKRQNWWMINVMCWFMQTYLTVWAAIIVSNYSLNIALVDIPLYYPNVYGNKHYMYIWNTFTHHFICPDLVKGESVSLGEIYKYVIEFSVQWELNSYPLDKMAAIWADDKLKCIFLNEKFCILFRISLKSAPKGLIDNRRALV